MGSSMRDAPGGNALSDTREVNDETHAPGARWLSQGDDWVLELSGAWRDHRAAVPDLPATDVVGSVRVKRHRAALLGRRARIHLVATTRPARPAFRGGGRAGSARGLAGDHRARAEQRTPRGGRGASGPCAGPRHAPGCEDPGLVGRMPQDVDLRGRGAAVVRPLDARGERHALVGPPVADRADRAAQPAHRGAGVFSRRA